MANSELSFNDRAMDVVDELTFRIHEMGVEVVPVGRSQVIDCGVNVIGSVAAGVLLARICMANLARVRLVPGHVKEVPLSVVSVNVGIPVAACMACQYAGWQIKVGDYFAMGSGPMRAAYGGEDLYNDIGYRQRARRVVGVLESDKLPGEEVFDYIASKCNLSPDRVTLLVARTASLAGGTQVVARSVETAMHKLHTLGFALDRVVGGFGAAPVPPVAKSDLKAIGRTNDSVLYGGEVTLYVTGDDDSISQLGPQVPSSSSRDYGRPFAEVFKGYGNDFYKVDPMLFSPAVVSFQNVQTGRVQTFGALNHDVLAASFFG
ncbi:MAG: methenyltetrahydromethanopterin cyclohydrolase [Planctomycetes bacterium]|nr:methenyltetrahydromethanopterin cyclohydrolase [Planctomycetota bacterium]